MGKVRRAVTRAQYAALGAAIGAAVGGLFGRSAASTGGATGALVGALVGEYRSRSTEEGSVTDRLKPGSEDEDGDEGYDPGDAIEETIRERIEGSLPDRE